MDKYLGNKRVLLPAIHDFVGEHCPDTASVCDIFTGTTNVARSFRLQGMRVIANDVNRFCYVLGKAYLGTRSYPRFDGLGKLRFVPEILEQVEQRFKQAVVRDRECLFPSSRTDRVLGGMRRLAQVLASLNDLPVCHGPITDYFTQFGERSRFRSVRGTTGQRNYFSANNAGRLDAILQRVRSWWQGGQLERQELFLILTAVLEEVTLVANVNGTFHDFNRDRLWPNAHQQLFLKLPLVHCMRASNQVYCQDAMVLAHQLPCHDLLYIDPPYNFRQYTAYYHFLNFLAAFPFLSDVRGYLEELDFVRGQNPADDFASVYSRRDSFIGALRHLITNTSSRYVVLSYYGGRNHWNHWSSGDRTKDVGRELLRELFSDGELFSEYTDSPAIEVRQNYQSRVGEKKQLVDEYLFFGKRRNQCARFKATARSTALVSAVNQKLGLMEFAPA